MAANAVALVVLFAGVLVVIRFSTPFHNRSSSNFAYTLVTMFSTIAP